MDVETIVLVLLTALWGFCAGVFVATSTQRRMVRMVRDEMRELTRETLDRMPVLSANDFVRARARVIRERQGLN